MYDPGPEELAFGRWQQGKFQDVERIAALIKRVSANRTILMVEHNLKVVANLSDRITVLTRGRVLAEGDYSSVSKNPEVRQAYLGVGHD